MKDEATLFILKNGVDLPAIRAKLKQKSDLTTAFRIRFEFEGLSVVSLYVMQRFLLLLGLIWAGMAIQQVTVFGQLNEPKRLRIGASLGAGGLHTYVGPSVDVHYHTTSLRVSPGFLFYGVGITQKAGFWRKSNGVDKIPIIFSFYYLDDYLFTTVKRNLTPAAPQRKDLDLYMIMAGAHFPLDRRDRVFGEAQIGMMIIREHFFDFYDIPVPSKTYFYPMVEVRIGGILQLHQYRKQIMR